MIGHFIVNVTTIVGSINPVLRFALFPIGIDQLTDEVILIAPFCQASVI